MTEVEVNAVDGAEAPARTHGLRDLASRLYNGEAGIDVVGRRKIWYTVAAVILLAGIVTMFVRPFNWGIEFRGGNTFTVPASVGTLEDVRATVEEAVAGFGAEVASAQRVGSTDGRESYVVKTTLLDEDATQAAVKATEIRTAIAERFGLQTDDIAEAAVSGTWGASVTRQAVIGALVFLVLVVLYLSLVFREWKMAVAALAGLLQNLLLTAAVYLAVGFEVTPSTVIGFLTILGFALYDTVVVFDKVRENTRGITGNPNRTYGEAANLAVNQTLMRSINTAIVALLPVGGLLFIGAGILGAGTLKDLGLVLFIGMLTAVYSSIFFATPVLVDLKEAEPRFKQHKQRVLQRRAAGDRPARPVKAAPASASVRPAAPSRTEPAAAPERDLAGT
ncbi:MAG: protein translocase subunit SecF, partial [Micromonosporaceae bacterium]|nr:protein translocase subunit SecF [Micromonosporaceae bacterium]